MKILLLYTYNKGYLSSFFQELSVKLTQEGHDVVCFSWKATISERIIDGVQIIVKKKKGYRSNYRNVYNIIKKERPDVILSNFSYVNPALLFGKMFGVKKNIVWFHSLNSQINATRTNVFIKKQFLKLANIVIANSSLTKKELHGIYEVSEHKLRTVPFWTNINDCKSRVFVSNYSTEKQVLKIGCPGRLVSHKNQKIILKALFDIKSTFNYDFRLFVAGEGDEKSNLEALTQISNLKRNITFMGNLSAEEMVNFYNQIDVVVLPSLYEAFGLVFIEAISLGTPVIVSSQFGALTFIDDEKFKKENFTFNPESATGLKEKLLPYFKNEGLSNKYFIELYEETFNKENIYNKIKSILTQKL